MFGIAESAFLFVLLFFALISLVAVYYKIRFGSILLMLIFALVILNLIFIRWKGIHLNRYTWVIIAFLSLIGFLVSVASIKKDDELEDFEEPVEDVEPVVETTTPGKFAASKRGSSYHAPKCEWAKKINKNSLVWFDSEEAAKKEGYKAHSCLKE